MGRVSCQNSKKIPRTLNGTQEVSKLLFNSDCRSSSTNLVANTILAEEELPLKFAALTCCFRSKVLTEKILVA